MTGFIENELVASGLLYRPHRIDLSLASNNVFYKLLIPEPQIMTFFYNLTLKCSFTQKIKPDFFLITVFSVFMTLNFKPFLLLCWFLFFLFSCPLWL